MIEWTCTLCGHVGFADSQLDQALDVTAHYTAPTEPTETP